MKKLVDREKYIRLSKKRYLKRLKRKEKKFRYARNNYYITFKKPKSQHKDLKNNLKLARIYAPSIFSILKNPEETIVFLNRIENQFNKRKGVFIVLKDVSEIDYSAITLLLSIMHKLKLNKIIFNGDFPLKENVRKKFLSSDFFKSLSDDISPGDFTLKKNNRILGLANKIVDPEIGLKIMSEVTQKIWGEKRTCKGLQRTLIELMQNTENHASTKINKQVHWWLSWDFDEENKEADFYFVDYGQGVINNVISGENHKLLKKFVQYALNMVKSSGEQEIIKSLMYGEHKKKSYFRGKGLPGIYDVQKTGGIKELVLVTNNTFSDVQNNSFNRLTNGFNGVFFHWKININSTNDIWQQ